MMSELQAILAPDIVPMLVANGVAVLLGTCLMVVALTSGAEAPQATQRAAARV